MGEGSRFSAQTLSVLAAFCADPQAWRHGYGIAKDTGLKSGSLDPILIRLADRGLVEARWEEEQPSGRPRRHLYRLTSDGLASAQAALAAAAQPARRSGVWVRRGRGVALGPMAMADGQGGSARLSAACRES